MILFRTDFHFRKDFILWVQSILSILLEKLCEYIIQICIIRCDRRNSFVIYRLGNLTSKHFVQNQRSSINICLGSRYFTFDTLFRCCILEIRHSITFLCFDDSQQFILRKMCNTKITDNRL